MTRELRPYEEFDQSVGRSSERGPYPTPAWWTEAGVQDRRNGGQHAVAMRQIRRDTELAQADAARRLIEDVAEMQADARYVTEAKFVLDRADKETKILAGDNPELQAKFRLLDDELYQRTRIRRVRRGR